MRSRRKTIMSTLSLTPDWCGKLNSLWDTFDSGRAKRLDRQDLCTKEAQVITCASTVPWISIRTKIGCQISSNPTRVYVRFTSSFFVSQNCSHENRIERVTFYRFVISSGPIMLNADLIIAYLVFKFILLYMKKWEILSSVCREYIC